MIKKKRKKSTLKKVLATTGAVVGVGAIALTGAVGVNEIKDKDASIAELKTEATQVNTKLNATEILLDSTLEQLEEKQAELNASNASNIELQASLTQAQALVAGYKDDLQKLRAMVEDTSTLAPTLTNSEAIELQNTLIEFISIVNADIAELNATIENKEASINDLNARIAELEENLNVNVNELLVNNARLSMELTGIYDIDVNYLGLNESQLLVVADVNDVVADLGCFSSAKLVKFYEVVADSGQEIVLRNSYQPSAFAGSIIDSNGKVVYDNTNDRFFSKLNYSFANLIANCSGTISNVTGSFGVYDNYWIEITNSPNTYVDIAVSDEIVEEITLSGSINFSTITIENADGTSKGNVSLDEIKARIDEFSEVRILNVSKNTANIIAFR